MQAIKDVELAFVPMNLPYTMSPDEAAACVKAMKPRVVYPYHFVWLGPEDLWRCAERHWYRSSPPRLVIGGPLDAGALPWARPARAAHVLE